MRAKILAVALLCVAGTPTYAQILNPVTPLDGGTPVGAGNPLHVTGSFSASLGGFVPSLSYTTLTATASSSASTALPTNTGTVAFQNQTAVAVSCTLASGAAAALVNEIIVPAGSTIFIGTTGYDHAACINQTGSASNVIILAGGTGLGTGFGGGGSGGGGGAVTLASGAVASGAYSAGAYAAGAVIAGAFVDGWDLTQGTKADAAWVSGSGSVIALLKNIAGGVAGSIPACGASPCVTTIGNVGQMANVGGTDTKSIKCGSSIVYDASTNGSTQLVALSGATSVYVCGYTILAGGTVNVKLITGTGTACVTGAASVTPAYQLTAQTGVADGANEYRGLKGAASSELCINTSAGVAVQAIVYYTQF